MDIHSLSTSERILLAEEIWDSVHDKSDEIELSPEQIKLLDARLEAYDEDGETGDSWNNARARIQNTL
jgi:putative addiction module component (TIGR02574 family)